jgi:hypothetical protein
MLEAFGFAAPGAVAGASHLVDSADNLATLR